MTHVCKRLILGLLKGFLSFYAINFLTKSAPKKRKEKKKREVLLING